MDTARKKEIKCARGLLFMVVHKMRMKAYFKSPHRPED